MYYHQLKRVLVGSCGRGYWSSVSAWRLGGGGGGGGGGRSVELVIQKCKVHLYSFNCHSFGSYDMAQRL
jgi:hypothetical protein